MSKEYIPSDAAIALLSQIDNNCVIWTKGWTASQLKAMRPFNPITKTVYNGQNAMNLYLPQFELAQQDDDFEVDLRFSTLRQINGAGGSVKAGSKGYKIKFWAPIFQDRSGRYLKVYSMEDARRIDPKAVSRCCQRTFTVFSHRDVIWDNAETEAKFDAYRVRKYDEQSLSSNAKAEQLLKNTGVRISVCPCIQPSYLPHENRIYLPCNGDFANESRKWEVLFHELIHWTKYNIEGCSRTFSYPQEELTAEIGCFMLCQELEVDFVPGQKGGIYDYLGSWIRPFPESERKFVIDEAIAAADKAVKALLKFR